MTNQKEVFLGRTQDFELRFEYAGMKIPRNWDYNSTFTPFQTECAVMGIAWVEDVKKIQSFWMESMNMDSVADRC